MRAQTLRFSVVMSVYAGDQANQLVEAVESLLQQSITPDEIIVVRDGPVSKSLQSQLDFYDAKPLITLLQLSENSGAAKARQVGVEACKNEIIALMDADDICHKRRFEIQLCAFQKSAIDVVGGVIEEFEKEVGDLNRLRLLPQKHSDIVKLSKWRNPINNVTLMFKKKAFLNSGGYSDVRLSEDWDFILKIIAAGYKVQNVPETLVYVRSGNEMIQRRRRFSQVVAEIVLFWRAFRRGQMSLMQAIINTIIRVVVRTLPKWFTSLLYSKILRNR